MRISDILITNNYLSSMNNSKSNIQKLQEQILTGQKINKPSDSPSGTSKSMRLSESIQSNESFIKNIESTFSFLQITTSTMESIGDEVQNLKVLFTNLNNPLADTNLNTIADQIDLSLKAIMNLANTEYEGKYIFGGTDHSQAPYGFDKDIDGNDIAVQNVTSTTGEQKIRISQNTIQKVNVPGNDIFGAIGSNDLFNTLIEVRDNLRNGIKPDAAQTQIVEDFSKNILGKMTSAGEVMNRLDATKELLGGQILELQNLLSKEKETDIAKAVIDMQQQQYYLDMSYKMSASILPRSLLDFM